MIGQVFNDFEIPNWIGKPPDGTHLDIMKEDKLVRKFIMDEKGCYLFGRNADICDVHIDHSSGSRVHAAILWHKTLDRAFLVDLGSTHGTFIGKIRMESHRPLQLELDRPFHFGASTRFYVIRNKPKHELKSRFRASQKGVLNTQTNEHVLTEAEIDNLTEFNTAQNRRIFSSYRTADRIKGSLEGSVNRKRSYKSVSFLGEDEIINVEEADPSIGRYRNLVETSIIAKKKKPTVIQDRPLSCLKTQFIRQSQQTPIASSRTSVLSQFPVAAKLNINAPNPAPDFDDNPKCGRLPTENEKVPSADDESPRKKKYLKEAWPGKKESLLV
ncbi:hypothetical protein ACOME3_001688 [Neoechinorhynchus agilis]